jgi:protein-S-isoprenylcysteine O-methyltransferase Ste14
LAETAIVLAKAGIMPDEWNTRIFMWLTGSPIGVRGARYIAATLPLTLIGGSVIAVAGTGLRLSAYRALDRQFTYQLTLKDDHQLITSFPYNIVRHPSYTGWFVCEIGLGMIVLSKDGWMQNVVIPAVRNPSQTTGVVALAWMATTAAIITTVIPFLIVRTSVEDEMLKKRFGKEWEKWAKRVPYRLLPFLW